MLKITAIFLTLFFANFVQADTYLDHLKSLAAEKSLAKTPTWLALLHYAPHYLGIKSQGEVDGGNFYLSKDGKSNSEAELDSTLESFFRTDLSGDDHPQCRFVARYFWLKSELKFDTTRLPEQECPRYKEWLESINPEEVTVIFPAAYLNNPSSMFGHTLLRIDPSGQSKREKLTSYGVNYGANTSETQGLLFAIKGIFGGYPGGFSIAPYYTQVLDYSEIENRDIWEYELNLSKEEVLRLVRHLWELRGVTFDYYFFDENCSYHLLSLLENARPDTELRRRSSLWVVPIDSVRIVLAQRGILKRAVFRPSNKKILDKRFIELNPLEKVIAKRIGNHDEGALTDLEALDIKSQGNVLDAGVDLLTYRTYKKPALIKDESNYKFELFKKRSKLQVKAEDIEIPAPARPDLGHKTNRVALTLGSYNKNGFYELAYRPAYHDLLDPELGFTKGAQIQFLGTKLRHEEGRGLQLEKIDILDILSLSPWDDLFHGISWRFSTNIERADFGNSEKGLVYNLNGGGGVAIQPTEQITLFATTGPALLFSKKLKDVANLGVGSSVGSIVTVNDSAKFLLQLNGSEYFTGTDFRNYKGLIEASYTLSTNLAIRAGFERALNYGDERKFENWSSTTSISIVRYF